VILKQSNRLHFTQYQQKKIIPFFAKIKQQYTDCFEIDIVASVSHLKLTTYRPLQ